MINKKNIFVIGDSISIHYDPYLKKYLNNNIFYTRKEGESGNLDVASGANGGNSENVLAYLNELNNKHFKTNLLLINCGLHDIKRDFNSNVIAIDIKQYEKNIRSIIQIASKLSDKIIWITTTHVDDEQHKKFNISFYRLQSDVLKYNDIALSIMKEFEITVIDLYSFSIKLPLPHFCDHVHFIDTIRDLQGKYIASAINKM